MSKPHFADDGIHWSSHDLMSRNAQWMYAIGGRGVGKTYDAKVKRTRSFLKDGRKWIYLRRYETEFEDKADFFADITSVFPDYEFRVEGMRGYLRKVQKDPDKKPRPWRQCVYFVNLSSTLGKKSVPFPEVDYIVFDEFIIEQRNTRYLPREVKAMLDFYNTVDRFTDRVRVLFLANAVSLQNPYFVAFGLKPRSPEDGGRSFTSAMDGFHCVEMIDSDVYREKVSATRFGRMIAGTDYYDYAVGNKFAEEHMTFIEPKPSSALHIYNLAFDGQKVGVWMDAATSLYHLTRKAPGSAMTYCLTRDDLSIDTTMVERSAGFLRGLAKMYMLGKVRFDGYESRALFENIARYLNIR